MTFLSLAKPPASAKLGACLTEFLKFTFNWNNTKGKTIKDVLARNTDKNVLAFKTRKELNSWYEIEFNRKIESQ